MASSPRGVFGVVGAAGRTTESSKSFKKSSSTTIIAKDAALLDTIVDNNLLSSTNDLHRSNLMRMQIAELLEECQIQDLHNQKWATEAHEYLQLISQTVSKITINNKRSIQNQSDKPVSVKIQAGELKMEPIGCTKKPIGWTKKTGNAQVVPTFTLMMTVPNSTFSSKDYMNHRYFDKRNMIMEEVAQTLVEISNNKKKNELGKVDFIWSKGMDRPPHLQLIPPPSPSTSSKHNKKKSNKSKPNPKYQVHIHIGMESIDWIPKIRLVPNRCNIQHQQHDDQKINKMKGQYYNHCLTYDARHTFQDEYLHDIVENTNINSALILCQIWGLQRGLWRNHDGFDKECFALLLVYLLRTHKINSRMTPVQIMTVLLQTVASTNWLGEEEQQQGKRTAAAMAIDPDNNIRASQSQATQFVGEEQSTQYRTVLVLPLEGYTELETIHRSEIANLYRKQTKESPVTKDDPPTLLKAYSSTQVYRLGPVFLDPTMTYNYLGDVSPNYMRLLQSHALKSLNTLKQSRSAFRYLFMTFGRFWGQWDMYVQIPYHGNNGDDYDFELSTRRLVDKLERALSNRINGIRILSTGNGIMDTDATSTTDGAGTASSLSDQFPLQHAGEKISSLRTKKSSPTGTNVIVLGLSVNPETSRRVVDRGPPADHHKEVKEFVKLWGAKAGLRRFKDGAIVQAVVWNEDKEAESFQNEEKWNGGYIAKIVRHIIQLHYTKEPARFALPSLLSVVDGATSDEGSPPTAFTDPLLAHQSMLKAYTALSDFLRKNSQPPPGGSLGQSRLRLPLTIDAVEPLSPCLRYSELFPPVPHPLLGGSSATTSGRGKKMAGAIVSNPIEIQVRFGASSNWPTDLKAIGAAKTAMLIQLAAGIEAADGPDFGGPVSVSPSPYLDLGFRGYNFRIYVRADPEIRLLKGLTMPSPVAVSMFEELMKKHVISSSHHSTIHATHTLHPSAGTVVRISKRWVDSHLLSGLITMDAIELLVAKVYSDNVSSLLGSPATVMAGFLRFLHILATHDWIREPLIVDPRDHISDDDQEIIFQNFESMRGADMDKGPPMYIIAPYNKDGGEIDDATEDDSRIPNTKKKTCHKPSWRPSVESPEWVVVKRAAALAKRSYDFMTQCLKNFDDEDWSAIFRESNTAFQSYSVLFRVDSDLICDETSSSTCRNLGFTETDEEEGEGRLETAYSRSMKSRYIGPKPLRRKNYRNLQTSEDGVIVSWKPIEECVKVLRQRFSRHALFFYNELSPQVIGLVWRPGIFTPKSFSVMTSDYTRPFENEKKSDDNSDNTDTVIRSGSDMLREMSYYYKDIVVNVKSLDQSAFLRRRVTKRKSRGQADSAGSSREE